MSITKQRMNQIIKEELNRALEQRGLNEMMDQNYNDDLQSRLGRFTSPENVMGTPQHRAAHGPYVSDRRGAPSTPMGPASAEELERIRARRGDSFANLPYNTYDGPNSPNSPYYGLREADDDMDMDTGIDVVPDDAMGGDEDMDMGGEEMMAPLEQEIDWSQFDDDDAESVGAAFMDAIKQLREENPDEEPTAEAVVAMMQELLSAGEDEDMGGEEMEDEADFEDEAPMEDAEEEGALNEWLQRTNLLAGTRSRR